MGGGREREWVKIVFAPRDTEGGGGVKERKGPDIYSTQGSLNLQTSTFVPLVMQGRNNIITALG